MGLASCRSAAGDLVFPIIFTRLRESLGFSWATRILASVLLANSIVPLAMMRLPNRAAEKSLSHRSDSKFISWLASQLFDCSILQDTSFMLLSVAVALRSSGFSITFEQIDLFTRNWTTSSKAVYNSISRINMVTSLVGRTVLAAAADRSGAVNMLGLCALVSFVISLCVLAVRTSSSIVAWSVFGVFERAFASLVAAGIVGMDEKSRARVGAKLGTTLLMVGTGRLLADSIDFAVLNGSGGWPGHVYMCTTLFAASLACLVAAWMLRIKS